MLVSELYVHVRSESYIPHARRTHTRTLRLKLGYLRSAQRSASKRLIARTSLLPYSAEEDDDGSSGGCEPEPGLRSSMAADGAASRWVAMYQQWYRRCGRTGAS